MKHKTYPTYLAALSLTAAAAAAQTEPAWADADVTPSAPAGIRSPRLEPDAFTVPESDAVQALAFDPGNLLDLGALRASERAVLDAPYLAPGPGPQPPMTAIGVMRELDAAVRHELPGTTWARQGRWIVKAVRSPGADGLRLAFEPFGPDVDEVLVLAVSGATAEVTARLSGRTGRPGALRWTPTIPGDACLVVAPAAASAQVTLARIGHLSRPQGPGGGGVAYAGGSALPCHEDVLCYLGTGIESTRGAVARMTYVESSGGVFSCSGAVLNDLDTDTFAPYFLTSFVCVSTQSEADSTEFFWEYETDVCNGSVPPLSSVASTVGATLVETNQANDLAFLRLDEPLLPGTWLAGWTSASGIGSALHYGIHHPAGTHKRIVLVQPSQPSYCSQTPNFHHSKNLAGAVEPGSNGAPLFDGNDRIRGHLFGICSSGGTVDLCDPNGDWRVSWGKFERTFPIIRRWLEIGATIHVDASHLASGDGTPSNPFRSFLDGWWLSWERSRISVAPGQYAGNLTLGGRDVTVFATGPVTIGP